MKPAKSRTKRGKAPIAVTQSAAKRDRWKQKMESAQLDRWAEQLLGIPFGARDKTVTLPLRPIYLIDAERIAIANRLHYFALKPTIINAIVASRQRQGRRGNPGDPGRVWNIALDYEVTRDRFKLQKKTKAILEVMNAWQCKQKSAVTRAYTECKEDKGWQEWAALYRTKFPLEGVDNLRAISDELRTAARSPTNSSGIGRTRKVRTTKD